MYKDSDIIMWPSDDRLKDAIGKECYFSDWLTNFTKDVNNGKIKPDKLVAINHSALKPYKSEHHGNAWEVYHTFLIIKK